MASLIDTALGSDDTSGTTLATTDSFTAVTGDLIVAGTKYEGATASTALFDTGAATPTFSVLSPLYHHIALGDLGGASAYWIATAPGAINPRVVIGAARSFRRIWAYLFRPAAGMTFTLDAAATAAEGNSNAPTSNAASASVAGVAVAFFPLYQTMSWAPDSPWLEPAEFNPNASFASQYQIVSGAGSLTASGVAGAADFWIALMGILKEVRGPAVQVPFRRSFGRRRTRYGI